MNDCMGALLAGAACSEQRKPFLLYLARVPFPMMAIFATAVLLLIACQGPTVAYAGGSGLSESEIMLIDDRYLKAEIATDPPILKGKSDGIIMNVTIVDVDTDTPVHGIGYGLEVTDNDRTQLIELDAYSPDASSTITIMPSVDADAIIGEKTKDGLWLASSDAGLVVEGPVFLEGGIVHVLVTIKSIDGESVTGAETTFDIMYSMGQFIPFTVDMDGVVTDLIFATYLDRIDKFEYNPRTEGITATMPFDWSEGFIDSIPFVHAEYYIPKTVDTFEDHEILLAVNGINYFGTVDRSGKDDIVVHFLISSSKMMKLLDGIPDDQRDIMTFEIKPGKERQKEAENASLESGDKMTLLSSEEDWKFGLYLTPPGMIHPGSEVTLNLEFRDPVTNIMIPQITYDVDVLLDGQAVYSAKGQETPDGQDSITVTFETVGVAIIQISNVNDYATSGEFSFRITEPALQGDDPSEGGTDTDAAGAPAEGQSPSHNYNVEIAFGSFSIGCERDDSCYIPSSLDIMAGQTVQWTNLDGQAHTVTTGSPRQGFDGIFDSGIMPREAVFGHTFDAEGTFDYYCTLHPWMVGTVTVAGSTVEEEEEDPASIPDWIKLNAGWWADGQIDDAAFATGLEYMIKNDIIHIPGDAADADGDREPGSIDIPDWIKLNAGWWADGQIDDAAFILTIEWMITNSIINI